MRKLSGIGYGGLFIVGIVVLLLSPEYTTMLAGLLQNSDFLFPISIYKELSTNGALADWIFGGYTPYLELCFGWVLWWATQNITRTFILYTVLQQIFILFCLMYFCTSLFGRSQNLLRLCLLAVTASALFYAAGWFDTLYYLFFWYLHTTTACLTLIAMGALIRFTTAQCDGIKAWGNLIVCSIVCILATMSDALFLSQCLAPALIATVGMWIFHAISFRKGAIGILGMLYSAAAGLALYRLPVVWGSDRLVLNGLYFKPSLDLILHNGPQILSMVTSFWNNNLLFAILWCGFYVACIFISVHLLQTQNPSKAGFIWKRYLFAVFFFPLQLILSISTNLLSTIPAQRYLLPGLLTAFFWGWPLIIAFPEARRRVLILTKSWTVVPIWLFMMIAVFQAAPQVSNLTKLLYYYPDSIRCLDENATRYGLQHGLAQYWVARPITLLSRTGVTVSAVNVDLTPNPILNSSTGFHSILDFIAIDTDPLNRDGIDKEIVIQRYGNPNFSFVCGQNEFLIYNRLRDQGFREQFIHLTPFVQRSAR